MLIEGKFLGRIVGSSRGMTLIEVLVVTAIMGLIAAIMVPMYQIVQQRDKEARLLEILNDVNNGIQDYRTYVIKQGYAKIEAAITDEKKRTAAKDTMIASGAKFGYLYPIHPGKLLNPLGDTFEISTGPTAYDAAPGSVTIVINRRFLRRIPPHPFKLWYPNAHWELKEVASDTTFLPNTGPWRAWESGYGIATWMGWPTNNKATGVISLRSRGAGLSLAGDNTDDWPK